MILALVGCGKSKLIHEAAAEKLYISTLFKLSLQYAKENADYVCILSAKHGLLPLNRIVVPYNESLNTKTDAEIKIWSKLVYKDILKLKIPDLEIIYICGSSYKKYLMQWLPGKDPLLGLGLGKRLQWLKQHIAKGNKNTLFD